MFVQCEAMECMNAGQSSCLAARGFSGIVKKGDVSLTGVKYIPTWVYKNASGPTYSIVPVDDPSTVEEKTGIKGIQAQAQASYDRTYKIIGDGVNKVSEAYGF